MLTNEPYCKVLPIQNVCPRTYSYSPQYRDWYYQ